jgi:hypothetical protein
MPTNRITTTTRYLQGYVVPPTPDDPAPIPPDPDPIPQPEPAIGYSFSNLSGDYQAWSRGEQYLALLSALDVWYVRLNGTDTLIGDRVNSGSVMEHFMWSNSGDQYWWLNGTSIERRSVGGGLLQSISLPATVDSVAVQWRSGSGSGEGKQFIVGYDETAGHYIQWFSEGGLAESFWLSDIVTETHYHNASVRLTGLSFEPSGERQSLTFACKFDGTGVVQLETEDTENDWSHVTWDGDVVAYWSNVNQRIEVVDYANLHSGVTKKTISVASVAAINGTPDDFVQYQHGDMRGRRLCFSTRNSDTGKSSIFIYDLDTDVLRAIDREFVAGTEFEQQPRPSMSHDGTRVIYNSTAGLQVRNVQWSIADPERPAIWSWDSSAVAKSVFDDWLSGFPKTSGRPVPRTNTHRLEIAPGKYLQAPINHEMPTMDSDGTLRFAITDQSTDLHCDLRPDIPGEFIERWFLPRRTLYRFDMAFDVVDNDVGWSLGGGLEWAIPFQLWGPINGAWKAGLHPINPPIAIRIERYDHAELTLVVQAYGENSPTATEWTYSFSDTMPISLGTVRINMWVKLDHTGVDSYLRVDVNDSKFVELTNVKLGTPFAFNGSVPPSEIGVAGGTPQFGVYTGGRFESPGVEFVFSKLNIYRF